MVSVNLREISWSFLCKSSRLRIFVRGVNAKKELFSWADLYTAGINIILGQKSNGPLQAMDCKMPPVRPSFINSISHSSAASARQY